MPPKLMPGKEAKRYLDEAHDNYLRYNRLLSTPEDMGWAAVVLFYTALHLVQAHATAKCKADTRIKLPEKHLERNSYVANHCRNIDFDYSKLQDFSVSIRYLLYKPDANEIIKYHDEHFIPIRDYFTNIGFGWQSAI